MTALPEVTPIEGFVVTGFSARTQNKDEFDGSTAKIPGLWQQCHNSGLASEAAIFAVYTHYDSDAQGAYTYTVGIQAPEGTTERSFASVQAGQYLTFQGKGPMPATVMETWQRIWNYFETTTSHKRNYLSDFEAYQGADQVTIYIGIKNDSSD